MINCTFIIFVICGFIEGLLLFIFKAEIFDYNSELGFDTLAIKVDKKGDIKHYLKDKRKSHHDAPFVLKMWRFLSMVLGTILGWTLLWFLLDQRLNYFLNIDIKWEDIVIFLLSYIGISGRLPVIAESVQTWFRR